MDIEVTTARRRKVFRRLQAGQSKCKRHVKPQSTFAPYIYSSTYTHTYLDAGQEICNIPRLSKEGLEPWDDLFNGTILARSI